MPKLWDPVAKHWLSLYILLFALFSCDTIELFLAIVTAAMANSIEYGKRLIPQILDDLASTEPDRILYSIAKSSDISQGFQQVSARNFARAVDKTAWLLRKQIGESKTLQSVGYIGPRKISL